MHSQIKTALGFLSDADEAIHDAYQAVSKLEDTPMEDGETPDVHDVQTALDDADDAVSRAEAAIDDLQWELEQITPWERLGETLAMYLDLPPWDGEQPERLIAALEARMLIPEGQSHV